MKKRTTDGTSETESESGNSHAITAGPDNSTPPDASIATLAGTLISEAPDVQPHAIEQANLEAEAQKNRDVNGDEFNAAIHAANADGSPRLTQGGAYAKKRGRKGGASSAPSNPKIVIPGGAGVTEPAQLTKDQLARRGGAGAAILFMAVCIALGGDEFHPRKDEKIGLDDKAMLEGVFGDYFVATNREDLPPGWALVAGMAMYVLPRFAMPKTQTRLQRVKNWIGAKIVQFRARRAGLKVKVDTDSEAAIVKEEMDDRERYRKMSGGAPYRPQSQTAPAGGYSP